MILSQAEKAVAHHIFIPQKPVVVMARSNPEADCFQDFCVSQNIPMLRRLGGGGAVVLYPGSLVVSIGMWVDRYFDNPLFFRLFNKTFIAFFSQHLGIDGFYQDGISDLVYQEKKCLGSSLFRSKNYLLYQGSVLVTSDIPLINQCLAHPSREPNYR
ncbi:MAG: hypothetical protein OXC40_07540, partial [Proteobacteria bacterium]|nr:hypothetical protein [Pseudomonadota bacterium]